MTKQMNSPESVSEKHQLIRHLSKQLSIHLPHSLLPFMKKSPVAQSDGNTTVSDKAAGQNLPASRRSLAAKKRIKADSFYC